MDRNIEQPIFDTEKIAQILTAGSDLKENIASTFNQELARSVNLPNSNTENMQTGALPSENGVQTGALPSAENSQNEFGFAKKSDCDTDCDCLKIVAETSNDSQITAKINSESEQAENQNGSIFGKFKDAKTLLNAYNFLQAEFTRKCQKLADTQRELENLNHNGRIENANSTANLSGENSNGATHLVTENNASGTAENAKNTVNSTANLSGEIKGLAESTANGLAEENYKNIDDFVTSNTGSDRYREKITEIISENGLSNLPNKYQVAYIIAKQAESELAKKLNDTKFLSDVASSNAEIKEKIIADYIENLNNFIPAPSLMSGNSSSVCFAPSNRPSSIKEAGELFSKMLK